MSKIIVQAQQIIMSCEESFLIHSFGSEECKVISVQSPSIINSNEGEKTNEAPKKLVNEKSSDKDVVVNFVCCALSADNKWFAIQSNQKILIVYEISSWNIIYSKPLVRGASKIIFTSDNNNILVGDKTGDVYLFQLDLNDKGKLLLGHLSMILDIVMSDDNKYIITCDRDEKIRVSNYPNCYNIKTYCLGHTEFVTNIQLLPHKKKLLVSSSGDGTVKLWEYLSGKLIESFDINKILLNENTTEISEPVPSQLKYFTCKKLTENSSLLCVTLFKCSKIFVLLIKDNNFELLNEIKLESEAVHLQLSSLNTNIELSNVHSSESNGTNKRSDVKTELICLWILLNKSVISYEWNDSQKAFSLPENTQLNKSLSILNNNLTQLKVDDKGESIIYVLQKRKMDEVNDYYAKKQARIEEKNSKKKKNVPI